VGFTVITGELVTLMEWVEDIFGMYWTEDGCEMTMVEPFGFSFTFDEERFGTAVDELV
jgi:hypothetical protein